MPRRRALAVSVAIKMTLVGLAAFGAFAGLDRFTDKGFGWRLGAYPIAVLIVMNLRSVKNYLASVA